MPPKAEQLEIAANANIASACLNFPAILLYCCAGLPLANRASTLMTAYYAAYLLSVILPMVLLFACENRIRAGKTSAAVVSIVACAINLPAFIAMLYFGFKLLIESPREHGVFLIALAIAALYILFRNLRELSRCFVVFRNLNVHDRRGFEPVLNPTPVKSITPPKLDSDSQTSDD